MANSISAKIKESGIDQFIEEDIKNIKNDPFFENVREELKKSSTLQVNNQISNTIDFNKTLENNQTL